MEIINILNSINDLILKVANINHIILLCLADNMK